MTTALRPGRGTGPLPAGSLKAALAVVVFAGLLSLQALGTGGLVVGYLLVVAALVVAWALVLDPPGRVGIGAIGFLVAALVSLLSMRTEAAASILLVGAVVALVSAMVLQISRRPPRPGVVASLSSAATLGMIVVAGATLLGVREQDAGPEITQLFIGVAAATLLVGKLTDAVLPRPMVHQAVGIPGLVLGTLMGIGTAALYGTGFDVVSGGEALAVGTGSALSVSIFSVVAAMATVQGRPGFSDAAFAAAIPLLAAAPSAVLFAAVISS